MKSAAVQLQGQIPRIFYINYKILKFAPILKHMLIVNNAE
jgi:hypothetical protein